MLPPYVVIDLDHKRWRIEDAFNTVKRLLGLSYLWTGSINGIKLQIWATWLFYAVLVDLGEAQNPITYFSNPDIQKCLGIVKRQRKPKQKLIVAPFPDKQRGSEQFFFQSSLKPSLTTSLQP